MTANSYVMNNLYRMGCIKDDEEMAVFFTSNNEYRFELSRDNAQLWFTDKSYKFKCNIDIYDNNINKLLVHLNCNENDIMNILDCYTQINEFGMRDIICPALAPYRADGNYYMIGLELYRIDPVSELMMDVSQRWFNVKEYSPLKECLVDIISIQMDMGELEDLMNLFYFIFLIDQESNYPVIPTNIPPCEYF